MKKGFNLLKIQPEPPSVWTKFYDWIVGTARVVIIIVEIIVLVAFGVRVVVDMQAKNIDKQVAQHEAILGVMGGGETQFRRVQAKTNAYKQIWNNSPDYLDIITRINAVLPVNNTISNLTITIDKQNVLITGTAPKSKEEDVKKLEDNLKNNLPFLSDTVLQKLEDSTDQLKFTFSATLTNVSNKVFTNIKTDG